MVDIFHMAIFRKAALKINDVLAPMRTPVCAFRSRNFPDFGYDFVGFRCVWEVIP